MLNAFVNIFDTSDFPARWNCGRWSEPHGWAHIASDFAIFAAYVAIPCVLIYFVRHRKDVPFNKLFIAFGLFILSCGFGHLIEACIFWWPAYRLAGLVKIMTAIVSWVTVILMIPIVPYALSLPGLTKINKELEEQIEQRKIREEELKRKAEELERFNDNVLDRENRMIELKHEINELLERLGKKPRYQIGDSG